MKQLNELISNWLMKAAIPEDMALTFSNLLMLGAVLLIGVGIYFLLKYIGLRIIKTIAAKTPSKWDDILVEQKVFQRIILLIPAMMIYNVGPNTVKNIEGLSHIVQVVLNVYIVFVFTSILMAFLNAVHEIYRQYDISKVKPIKGYLQVVKIVVYIIVSVMIISMLLGTSPWPILTGMGALSAILLLIFKDTILGLVGSIQLSALDMVRPGDWIEMPKFSADGSVIDMNLTTVKVRNWDMTITTIPTYALISESFRNWRGMVESGGRRIKRSIQINMNSVKFCTPEMLERFSKIHRITDYIDRKEKELKEFNAKNVFDNSVLVNGRRQTNLGVFRAYVKEYLKNHPKVNTEMIMLVRQLQPTETGIPLEIYVFSADTAWGNYEDLQSDIFDHILASIPQFDLEVFQSPTGADFRKMAEK
ncbi:MAG TPA: mechanosensitive ion channel [Bacteroidales bacterium]|nr:mechanosensitive ion channel [Bacteroidales bacterium]